MKGNNVVCPVCGSKKEKLFWGEYSASQSAAFFCPSSRNINRNNSFEKCISKLWNETNASILECIECGFGFSNPYNGGDETFYSLFAEQIGYPKDKWDYNYALKNLIPSVSANKPKILDIGAGEGFFLDRIGNNFQKYAIEGSIITSKLLESKGINVLPNLESAIEHHYESFDVITLFQVFEHISEFRLFLDSIFKLLKKDGILIISVPNLVSVKNQFFYLGIIDMIPNHVNKWSENSLKLALEKSNLSIKILNYQPFNLDDIKSILHNTIKCEAISEKTMANKVYSIQNKKIRVFFLGLLAIPYFFKIIPVVLQGKLNNSNIILKAVKIL